MLFVPIGIWMANQKTTISVDFLLGAFPNVQHETTTLTLTGHAVRKIKPGTLEDNDMDRIKSRVARQQRVEKKLICVTNMQVLGATPEVMRIRNLNSES
jgi:hypothetical protein